MSEQIRTRYPAVGVGDDYYISDHDQVVENLDIHGYLINEGPPWGGQWLNIVARNCTIHGRPRD